MYWERSLGNIRDTATDYKAEGFKAYRVRNMTTVSLWAPSCCRSHAVEWVRGVRAAHRVRKTQCELLCLSLWAVPLSWTTSNAGLYRLHLFLFLSLSMDALQPLTVCLQGAGTKTQDPHCEPPAPVCSITAHKFELCSFFWLLRNLQKLIHEN